MKRNFSFFSLLGCLSAAFVLTSCKTHIDYFDYVSENRSNILIADGEDYHLRVYAVEKEYPYCTDGYVGELSPRAEIYFTIKNGGNTCLLSFLVNGTEMEGEMSYDSVQGEYFFSCAADLEACASLDLTIIHGEKQFDLTAHSVKQENTLSSTQILSALQASSPETFSSLTSGKDFQGEIYLRLIYETSPYYYVGVTGRDKKTTAFLLDAVSGQILATKQN